MSGRRLPKYIGLAEHVRELIRKDGLQAGDAIPTEPELESDFGCSRGTVRRALDVLVNEGLIRRKHGAGHFISRQTESSRESLIGLIVPNILNAEILRLSQLATVEAGKRGYQTLLCVGERHPSLERDFIRELRRLRVSAVIKFPTTADVDVERGIRASIRAVNIPYIVINDFWSDPGSEHRVGFDESTAISQAVTHLVELGHRRIAWADGSDGPRLKGVAALCSALRANGLRLPEKWIYYYPPYELPEVETMFSDRASAPTAVITPYDGMAVRLIEALGRHGHRVPEDMSVVNLNGLPQYSTSGLEVSAAIPPDRDIICKALDIVTSAEHGTAFSEYRFVTTFSRGRTSAPPNGEPSGKSVRAADHDKVKKESGIN